MNVGNQGTENPVKKIEPLISERFNLFQDIPITPLFFADTFQQFGMSPAKLLGQSVLKQKLRLA